MTTAAAGQGPVGTGEYEVRQGECMISIAAAKGHLWEYMWDHPGNKPLRDARRDPTALRPKDRVHVPPLRPKEEPHPTHKVHRFRRRGVPTTIDIQVFYLGKPRANQPYTLSIDDGAVIYTGQTDSHGELKHPLSPRARKATLWIGQGDDPPHYDLDLGSLDPITELSGVQGRLANLGYACGRPDGAMGVRTASAIQEFQHREGLEVTGELDDTTRQTLQKLYNA